MAYKNIVFVKLERRLLNDHRWYMMSDPAQLLYIKLILLAAETYNKIPKVIPTLMTVLRTDLEIGTFRCALEEVKKNFPKFKSNKHFYYFDEFEHKTNYIPDKQLLSNSPAIAKQGADIDIDIEKDIDIEQASPALKAALDKVFKKGFNIYSLINRVKKELRWGPRQNFPEEVLLRVCMAYEQENSKVKKPWPWFVKVLKLESANWNAQQQINQGEQYKKEGMAQSIKEILGMK